MRPARSCRERAAPTWLGRAPLARSGNFLLRLAGCQRKTWSPRFDELRLLAVPFAVVVVGRPCRRSRAAAFVALRGERPTGDPRSRPSNSMLGSGQTTPQDYRE